MKCIRKPVNRKGNGDVIIMSGLHIYQCMINPIKSYADWMRNDGIYSVHNPKHVFKP